MERGWVDSRRGRTAGAIWMNRLYRLYEASPEAALAEIEETVAQLGARLTAVSEAADSLRGLFDSTLQTLTTPAAQVPAPTRWTYDVRLPNVYFDDLFEPEFAPEGAKRWVRRSGLLRTRLGLPRNVQYDFSVRVVNFVVPETRPSFRLSVDDKEYPWLSVDDNLFSTVILEDPKEDGLEFEISIDSSQIPEEKNTSFSFSFIDIVKR
jgi:hypothetical protein